VLLLLLVGCSSPTPDLSPVAGALPPCPPTPNCVRSEPDTDADHAIEPLPLPPGLAPADALERLAALLTEDPRTTLVARGDSWLHVATRTRWLGFVDDVVVLVRSDAGRIEVRSASRVGPRRPGGQPGEDRVAAREVELRSSPKGNRTPACAVRGRCPNR
jgi:uncharacterized protein (DUF1499 family)